MNAAEKTPREVLAGLVQQWSVPEPNSGCWLWLGSASTARGVEYGHLCVKGRSLRAHRASYIAFVGPIPEGKVLDHLCRQTVCVNPRHLEVVSNAVNVLRGTSFSAENAVKTHCPRGHRYDRVLRSGGRWCRTCERDHRRAQAEELKRTRAARRAAATVRSLGGRWWLCLLCNQKFAGRNCWDGHGCKAEAA